MIRRRSDHQSIDSAGGVPYTARNAARTRRRSSIAHLARERRQRDTERVPGLVEIPAHGALREVENVGDLDAREALELGKAQNQTLPLRQLIDRGADAL